MSAHATKGHGSLWIEEREGRIKVLDIKGVCDDGIDTLEPQCISIAVFHLVLHAVFVVLAPQLCSIVVPYPPFRLVSVYSLFSTIVYPTYTFAAVLCVRRICCS
jgi:hypothetical protein